jgi:RNA polymerase sigma-70 factor (ECF subfamily)
MDTTELHRRLGELRPKLHRYCARMTGSVIDGEDVAQEALAKAIAAYEDTIPVLKLDGWVFRIAHNSALDFLRRRTRHPEVPEESLDMVAEPTDLVTDHSITAASMGTFMHLPVIQRSSVILMDVLGYTVREVGVILESSVPAVKSALHRGRARLRALAEQPVVPPPPALSAEERARLADYVTRFNARDFGTLRDMLAEDVRVELVNYRRIDGRKAVGNYFSNYDKIDDWHLRAGFVDRRPAILVFDADEPAARPRYFVLVEWAGESLVAIRDFRHARYVVDGAEIMTI